MHVANYGDLIWSSKAVVVRGSLTGQRATPQTLPVNLARRLNEANDPQGNVNKDKFTSLDILLLVHDLFVARRSDQRSFRALQPGGDGLRLSTSS